MNTLTYKDRPLNIYSIVIFFYIISAIAFECTPDTAYLSTMAIYLVFAVGMAYILMGMHITVNLYTVTLLLMYVYVYIMSLVSTAHPLLGPQTAYWVITCNILGYIIFIIISDKVEMIDTIFLASIIGGLVLVFRIVTIYGGIGEIFEIASSDGENRIGRQVTNENNIGLFLSGGLLSALLFMMKENLLKTKKILSLLSIVIFGIIIILTGSRTSLVFSVVGAVLFLMLFYRNSDIMKKMFLYIMIAAMAFGLIRMMKTVGFFSTINERFELLFEGFSGNSKYETDIMRGKMIRFGIEEFWNNPLIGNGTARSYVLFGTYSHNNFVELLMNYGIIGFSIYYLQYSVLLIRLFKIVRKERNIYAIYFFVYISMQMVLGVGWISYYDRIPQVIAAAAWGYLAHYDKTKGLTYEDKKYI